MTKAEMIFDKTRYACKKSIQDFGYRVNPNGRSVGFNTVFNDGIGCICTRTLNDMDKILSSKRKMLDLDRRLGIGTDESNLLKEQTYNMIESTILNAREALANW